MQDIISVELRESQTQTQESCFEVWATCFTSPAFTA